MPAPAASLKAIKEYYDGRCILDQDEQIVGALVLNQVLKRVDLNTILNYELLREDLGFDEVKSVTSKIRTFKTMIAEKAKLIVEIASTTSNSGQYQKQINDMEARLTKLRGKRDRAVKRDMSDEDVNETAGAKDKSKSKKQTTGKHTKGTNGESISKGTNAESISKGTNAKDIAKGTEHEAEEAEGRCDPA